MKRYQHYWWQLRGAYAPTRIAVLDLDVAGDAAGGNAPHNCTLPAYWCLARCELLHGMPAGISQACGYGPSDLWSAIARVVSSKENTWILLPNSGQILSAIGFWELLDSGSISLSGADWRGRSTSPVPGEDRGDGLCVLEDPPTLILCQLASLPGKLLLLDVRNYGIDLLNGGIDCATRSRRYLGGILSVLHALREDRPTSLRCTAASQAVQSLRSHWECVSLHCSTHAESNRLARGSIYGGRCEAYRTGEIREECYHVDVRNMYPSICLDLPVPVSLRRYHESKRAARKAVSSGGPAVAADVRIRCDEPRYPCHRLGAVVYPCGDYRTVLAGPELCEASERGDIADIFSAAEYTCRPVLSGFYTYWLEKLSKARACGDEMLCQFIKAMMNGLIGKFMEPGRRWVPCAHSGVTDPYAVYYGVDADGNRCRYRNIAGYTQMEEVHEESYWSIPAIGSWVQSAGRIRLWNYVKEAGRENVWYVDTDSIICGQTGFDCLLRRGLIREGEIGHLRLVGRARKCTIYGVRDYRFGGNTACSGVPRGEIRDGESRADYWKRLRISAEIAMGRRPGTSE